MSHPRALAPGARQLPEHHITIRVPWHDGGWAGSVCSKPLDNTSCLVLPRISEHKCDEREAENAGARLDALAMEELPICVDERVAFMAPFEIVRTLRHPYAETSPETHGHFRPTRFVQPPYSATCVPFRWMLRGEVEGDEKGNKQGLAERLGIDWIPDREPDLSFDTSWVQERGNQLALLDTFFGALRSEESLCFFYAKRTPLSEQSRRVIVGVGRVLSVGAPTECESNASDPPLRCVFWERNVGHSIRPGFLDGFLFPYQELTELTSEGEISDPEQFVAFAPDEHFSAYSYASELLTHDGAVASLVACAAALHRICERVEGPWDEALRWIDLQLNRLWKARGAFPGLGSALNAFGYEWGFRHGSLLAYEIELQRERAGGSSWEIVDQVMRDPERLGGPIAKLLTPGLCKGWNSLTRDRRALLELLSRCAVSEAQALRMYDRTEREDVGIKASDDELLANPYSLFERDRRSSDPIAFGAVDRGLFPDESIRHDSPIQEPSRVDDPADPRRVRALTVDLLEEASKQGHTVLPQSWVIRRARDRALQPPCPLGENVLAATESAFGSVVQQVSTGTGDTAYQIDRLSKCREIIRREVCGRQKGKLHTASHDWRGLVDAGLATPLPDGAEEHELEERARTEKAGAIEHLLGPL